MRASSFQEARAARRYVGIEEEVGEPRKPNIPIEAPRRAEQRGSESGQGRDELGFG